MARIITDFQTAVEQAQSDQREAICKGGVTNHAWSAAIVNADKTYREAVSKAGREAIEKAKKLAMLEALDKGVRLLCSSIRNMEVQGMEDQPEVTQQLVKDAFMVGQTVFVRSGTDWRRRVIEAITVRRHAHCPHCAMPLLGEPRFWFKDYGNVPLADVIAKEDLSLGEWRGELERK